MNDDDLFIVSGRTIKELAIAWDQGAAGWFRRALDECKEQPIDPDMNHVCKLTTEINDNGSMTIRLLKFVPIRVEHD